MGKGVKAAGNHLPLGDAEGVGGIQQGKFGVASGIIPAGLDFQLLVGDDRAAVHFAASSGGGDDDAQGKRLKVDDAGAGPEVRPDIPLVDRRQRDGLAAVHDATAAHAEDQVDLIFTGQPRSLQNLLVGGVGHDAGKLGDILPGFAEAFHHLVIDAVLLDGASAIAEQDIFSVVLGKAAEIFPDAALAEKGLGGIFKDEVIHNRSSSFAHSLTD